MSRNLSASLSLAAVCVLAMTGCNAKKATPNRSEVASPTTIRDAVRLTGTIEPLDSVDLKSEVSGRITKVFFQEGDAVKRGQLILQLDTVPLLLSRDKFALQVDRADLALKIARRDVDRTKALVATGSVTANLLEDLDVAVQRAQLDLRDAKLSLRNAELDLSRTKIRSPMDGRLINFPAEVGEVASSATGINGGSALGTIADPTKLKVVVEVGELDFGRLRLGMPVKVSTEGGRPRPGRVSFIPSSARASSDTKTIKVFPVEVVLDGESDGILPGMTVGVDFVFLEKDVAVSVPFEAVKSGKAGGRSKGSGSLAADTAKTTDSVVAKPGSAHRGAADSAAVARTDGKSGREGANGRAGRSGPGRSKASDSSNGAVAIKSGTVLVRGEKGEFVSRSVKIGVTDYRRTEIVDGLAVGDTVWILDDAAAGKSAAGARGPGGAR